MRKSVAAVVGAFAAGAVVALAGPASAAGTAVIHVPSDFNPTLSDTRATGHYQVVGTGLRVWTEGATSTDKVAEYVDTNTPLASVAGGPEPTLAVTNNGSGTIPPGYQLEVDFNGDGSIDGILVGETIYSPDWWLSNGSESFVKAGAPSHTGGSGSTNHGTLDQWSSAFPNAVVKAFGFSLGSGVYGDYVINSINFAGITYTFAKDVTLTNKDQCKNGGWATSTMPVYKNQGQCVSSFASAK